MKKALQITILALLGASTAWSQSVYPGQFEGKVNSSLSTKVQAFDLRDIRLTESRFRIYNTKCVTVKAKARKGLVINRIGRCKHASYLSA